MSTRDAARPASVASSPPAWPLAAGRLRPRCPSRGPVVETESEGSRDEPPAASSTPSRRSRASSPTDIVTDFLEAMTATPIQTNMARQFLTSDADAAWNPRRDDHLRRGVAPRGHRRADRSGWPTPDRLDGRGSSAARCRGRAHARVPDGPRGRRVAHRRGARRADRARTWFDQRFRQVVALLLRPERPDPGARSRSTCRAASSSPTALTQALLRGPGPDARPGLDELHPAAA